MNNLKILWNGILKENPTLVLVLGTCPTLAVTTQAINGVGMGLAATVVLICSNIMISLLKNLIPDKIRIPCYIVLIAGFVSVVDMLLNAYLPDLHAALGIYIPLIVVNCIILGRAEMFASKNTVVASAMDGIGMGLGFTLALTVIGSIRELLGSGTLFGVSVTAGLFDPISIFSQPAGGFITFGCIIALVNWLTKSSAEKRKKRSGMACATCAGCDGCKEEGGEEEQ